MPYLLLQFVFGRLEIELKVQGVLKSRVLFDVSHNISIILYGIFVEVTTREAACHLQDFIFTCCVEFLAECHILAEFCGPMAPTT